MGSLAGVKKCNWRVAQRADARAALRRRRPAHSPFTLSFYLVKSSAADTNMPSLYGAFFQGQNLFRFGPATIATDPW
jgi:hypothetical protein